MHIENITSAQNPKVKSVLALGEKSRQRRGSGLFTVEGRRELGLCLAAGYSIRSLYVCGEILGADTLEDIVSQSVKSNPDCQVIQIPPYVYDKIAYRGGTEGVLAVAGCKERSLGDIALGENPLVIVLESVEKPGNLGAVLRSADAAGVDAVLVCDPLTDLYNPNLIRASVGTLFSLQIVSCSSDEAIKWLKDNGLKIFTAQLQDSSWYYDTDMRGGSAIVMGTESTGLTDKWREAADAHIKIPMLGSIDSLNVSVSAAILLYEAVRQRNSLVK